jgi:hypothetical protein
MNYWKALMDLNAERERLDRTIAVLESMQADSVRPARRGRKSMSESERRIVSERMRAYWERRKNGNASAAAGG